MAEGILKSRAHNASLPWVVESAGTNGYHVGEPPHRLAQKVSRLHGIDISSKRCRNFVPQDFDRFDKIYAMAKDVISDMRIIAGSKFDASKTDLLMNEAYPGKNLDIPDPWYGGEQDFEHAFEMIDTACSALVSKYTTGMPA